MLPLLVITGTLLSASVAAKQHKEGERIEPNYLAFFTPGIRLFPLGILL